MSLIGAFTGSDARRYAEDAYNRNSQQMQQGYTISLGYQKQGYESAQNRLSPYEAAGRQGQTAYTNLLGMNGAGAQGQARGAYEAFNPYIGNDISMADRAIQRRSAATGQLDGGLNALARQRSAMEMGSRDFYGYADRLGALGQQGFQAGNALAGLDQNNAQQQIGIENALRSGNVQNSTQFGNAQAQASQGGMNNMLALGSLALAPFTGGTSLAGLAAKGIGSMFGSGANAIGPWTTTGQRA